MVLYKIQSNSKSCKAGNDGIVCNSSAIFPLGGESARANHSYSWSPSGANWQSGTSSTSAQPLVLVAVNTTFTLTATDTITGCQITDMVDIVVNNSPTAGNAPDILICKNIGDTIGLPQVPGATYSWSPTSGLSCTTCPMPIANPSTTTTIPIQLLILDYFLRLINFKSILLSQISTLLLCHLQLRPPGGILLTVGCQPLW